MNDASVSARVRRVEVLAVADAADVAALAERCIDEHGEPVILAGPEIGVVVLQVREPVGDERFYLGEVLVTRAEVELDGQRGWSMRLGDDRVAALAAAICDAVAELGGPLTADVDALCTGTTAARDQRRAAEWSELAPTRVEFEELW